MQLHYWKLVGRWLFRTSILLLATTRRPPTLGFREAGWAAGQFSSAPASTLALESTWGRSCSRNIPSLEWSRHIIWAASSSTARTQKHDQVSACVNVEQILGFILHLTPSHVCEQGHRWGCTQGWTSSGTQKGCLELQCLCLSNSTARKTLTFTLHARVDRSG